jgi:hypothetical protein
LTQKRGDKKLGDRYIMHVLSPFYFQIAILRFDGYIEVNDEERNMGRGRIKNGTGAVTGYAAQFFSGN